MENILFLHAGSELYGADIILYNIVKNLDKNKYNIYVILPNYGPLVEKIRKENVFCEVIEYPILRRKYFSIKGIFYYLSNYRKKCNEIYSLLKDKNITIIHNNTMAVLEGLYLKTKFNAKLVTHIHEIIKNPQWLGPMLSKILVKNSDHVVCVSEAVAKELKSSNEKLKIKVIYNGIDNSIFHPGYSVNKLRKEFNIPDRYLIIGMIGRVNSWKGQNDFLDAVTPLLRRYPNICTLLVGGVFEGEEWRFENLKKRIDELNSKYSNRIFLSNFRKDNYLIHNLIDIYVMPSTNPDPLPTVVLESMASGKPIVGYAHGGVCEMVKNNDTGILVTPNNVYELSQAIEFLIVNQTIRECMGRKALKREISFFSIDNQIQRLCEIYGN